MDRTVEYVKGVSSLGLIPVTGVEFIAMFRVSEQAGPLTVDTALKGFLESTATSRPVALDWNLTRVLTTRSVDTHKIGLAFLLLKKSDLENINKREFDNGK